MVSNEDKIKATIVELEIEQKMLEVSYEDGYQKGKSRAYVESMLMVAAMVVFMYLSRV